MCVCTRVRACVRDDVRPVHASWVVLLFLLSMLAFLIFRTMILMTLQDSGTWVQKISVNSNCFQHLLF